jgi:hypothetical protein
MALMPMTAGRSAFHSNLTRWRPRASCMASVPMSAYMSTRHVKPPAPFSFLSFFLPPFSCSTAPQAFSRPDRRIVVGLRAEMLSSLWPLFSGHTPPGTLGLYSNRARRQGLIGRVDTLLSVVLTRPRPSDVPSQAQRTRKISSRRTGVKLDTGWIVQRRGWDLKTSVNKL